VIEQQLVRTRNGSRETVLDRHDAGSGASLPHGVEDIGERHAGQQRRVASHQDPRRLLAVGARFALIRGVGDCGRDAHARVSSCRSSTDRVSRMICSKMRAAASAGSGPRARSRTRSITVASRAVSVHQGARRARHRSDRCRAGIAPADRAACRCPANRPSCETSLKSERPASLFGRRAVESLFRRMFSPPGQPPEKKKPNA